ncbi:hypothetical protein BpHYR1_009815, partial [Brachionus plicatilis]
MKKQSLEKQQQIYFLKTTYYQKKEPHKLNKHISNIGKMNAKWKKLDFMVLLTTYGVIDNELVGSLRTFLVLYGSLWFFLVLYGSL